MASFLVYYAFSHRVAWPEALDWMEPWWLGAFLGAFPLIFGTLRQARGMSQPLSYPAYWLGVPRPVAALFIIALLRSQLWGLGFPGQLLIGLLVILLSYLHLSTLPFINGKGRRWMTWAKVGMIWFLGGSPLFWILAGLGFGHPEWIFDYVAFSLFMYVFFSWTQIPKEDYRRIKRYVDGGEIELPLVHKENDWCPKRGLPILEET